MSSRVWKLARRQHGVITRTQLLDLDFSSRAIEHRLAAGRLHALYRAVYAVGRPGLTRHGRWMAAVLGCGPGATLSHGSAAAYLGIGNERGRRIEVSVPSHASGRTSGVWVHRRATFGTGEIAVREAIPVTSPALTLVDLASYLSRDRLEAAINQADKGDLVDPETLRSTLDRMPSRPGLAALRKTLDRRTFTLTDSELERRFLPIARRAGLPRPVTGQWVNGFKADFYWPELGLVVETDGLRYHRTPAQQARDRVRDQVHTAAGLIPLRFTRAQVTFEPAHVEETLAATVARLRLTTLPRHG
jgi:very-short-patch-repair endonuclease